MFAVHYCGQCRQKVQRSTCVAEPEGLFGPELLCPHCGGLVVARFTRLGWLAVIAGAAILGYVVWWLQVRV